MELINIFNHVLVNALAENSRIVGFDESDDDDLIYDVEDVDDEEEDCTERRTG